MICGQAVGDPGAKRPGTVCKSKCTFIRSSRLQHGTLCPSFTNLYRPRLWASRWVQGQRCLAFSTAEESDLPSVRKDDDSAQQPQLINSRKAAHRSDHIPAAMGSEAMRDTTMVEPLALNDQEMGLPLQDSLGPELMKLLDDLGGEDGWCEGGQAAVGAALDTAGLDRLDVFMDDAVGIPMPQDPQKAMELEQHKPRSNSCMLPPSAYRAPPLSEHYSGSYSELLPPQSAFQQIVMPSTPPTPVSRPATQKPRSIRRARSGLPAHLQSRSSSEPQEVLRRANSGSELQESQKQASKQVLSSSPKSTSTVFRPFSHLAAVEVFPEASGNSSSRTYMPSV